MTVDDHSTKELYHWEKNQASVIILLMANIVLKILISHIYIDFCGWEDCTRIKTQSLENFVQISKNNKWYIKQNLHIYLT